MSSGQIEPPVELVELLRAKPSLAVLTGAGISAESGVPTFREAQSGLWSRYRPEALATPEAFNAHPRRVWDWYQWRRELVARAEPNAGHRAVRRLECAFPDFQLITQNTDGLHQRAGSEQVIELHGNLHRNICSRERTGAVARGNDEARPPVCANCGALLRPDVVWFGEMLPSDTLSAAHGSAEACRVMLVIGTSGLVYPAAGLPHTARSHGATVVEINPEPTPLSDEADYRLEQPAGTGLPALVDAVLGQVARK